MQNSLGSRFGVYQGCLRLHVYYYNLQFPNIFVWELKEEELEQMAADGGGKLGLKHMTTYSLDPEIILPCYFAYFEFDPNDMDTV